MKKIIISSALILILIVLGYLSSGIWMPLLFEPTDTTIKQGKTVEEITSQEIKQKEAGRTRTEKDTDTGKENNKTQKKQESSAEPGKKKQSENKNSEDSKSEKQPEEQQDVEELQAEKQNQQRDNPEEPIEVIANNLNIPWEIAFLPDGDLLVTERPGTLKRLGKKEEGYQLQDAYHIGEGGLLGLALHPNFDNNRYLYIYLTTNKNEENIENQVRRYKYTRSDQLAEEKIILDDIPAGRWHNGGRVEFGPEGLLYITTGDAQRENLSQDKNSLAGKILRVTDTGKVPSQNPFPNPTYSFGHRNPQGLAWSGSGQLWATEHGSSAKDELNLIRKGINYGWPEIRGDQTNPNMETPKVHSGRTETWAPSGAAYINSSVFFVGLRGETLYEARLTSDETNVKEMVAHFRQDYGRLRHVEIGPDGDMYILTSNRDGRGSPTSADDRIIKIDPKVFE